MENRISVLIRTFNSEKTLERVFSGIRIQEGDEYVIVDSDSTDATLKIATEHGARIVKAPKPFHYSKSLNAGFKAAVNPWVLVISSHSIPVVLDFLEIYRREVSHFTEDIIAGYAVASLTGDPQKELPSDKVSIFGAADFSQTEHICNNTNAIYRRSAWESMPFDETIRTGEDRVWIMSMIQRGFRYAYIPQARCIHRNQASLSYMFRKAYRDSRALRRPNHKPMTLLQLGGAWKNLLKLWLSGKIDSGNLIRHSVFAIGQFFGSRRSENNTPINGMS